MELKGVLASSRYLRQWWKLLGLLLCLFSANLSAQSTEQSLRVAFVFNFIKFIEWPESPSPNFNLCVIHQGGEGDISKALELLDGREIRQQRLKVVPLNSTSIELKPFSNCQLVYWPNNVTKVVLPDPVPSGVLVVGDEVAAADSAVAIIMALSSKKQLEFSINLSAAERAGVKISSQILKLSRPKNTGGG